MSRPAYILFATILPLLACTAAVAQVRQYRAEAVKQYPHDVTSYTQGLFFENGQMYESTGQNGNSTFRKVDLETGKAQRRLDFDEKYFVEGSTVLGNNLYILTWTSRVAFVYDFASLTYRSTLSYPRQGWGLTTDGKSLIASDGSSRLYYLSPDMKVTRTLNVKLHGKALNYLNELEYIDGKIWANVYTTNMVVVIDPATGIVESVIDCSGLLDPDLRTADTDVLNGIAYDDTSGKIYLTGKNWPLLFEIRLVEKK